MVRFKIRRNEKKKDSTNSDQISKLSRSHTINNNNNNINNNNNNSNLTNREKKCLLQNDKIDIVNNKQQSSGLTTVTTGLNNNNNNNKTTNRDRPSPYQMLSYEWILRLQEVLETELMISPHSDYQYMPDLQMNLRQLIVAVKKRLELAGISLKDIRLNGGATCYVVGEEENFDYNDIDLLFGVDLSNGSSYNQIKSILLNALTEFMIDYKGNKENLSEPFLKDCYVKKMVLVNGPNGDFWSLFSLGNPKKGEKVVEMKFVLRMRRQFEFTVDSFQIILDSMLSFYEKSNRAIDKHFYPPVVVESVSGNFKEALFHLRHRLIATRNPEEIRGGGLLKYCKLLVEGYTPMDSHSIHILERYMCSRFFIDFPELHKQYRMLCSYLKNHFHKKESLKVSYLQTLRRVVDKSTVCLMFYDRRQTIQLINCLIQKVLYEDDSLSDVETMGFEIISSSNKTNHNNNNCISTSTTINPLTNNNNNSNNNTNTPRTIQLEEFNSHHWSLDQVFYGTSYFPQEAYIQYALPPTLINATGSMIDNVDTTTLDITTTTAAAAACVSSSSPSVIGEYIISIPDNNNDCCVGGVGVMNSHTTTTTTMQTASSTLFMSPPLIIGTESVNGPATMMGFWSIPAAASSLFGESFTPIICMSQESSPSLTEETILSAERALCAEEEVEM